MGHFDYLIVGGGLTGDAAAEAIRELDPNGSVGLMTAEPHPPYNRPPLSKGLWKGESQDSVWRPSLEGLELMLGRRAVGLDRASRTVTDDRGSVFTYGRLLIATGGRPRRLPFGKDEILYFRTLDDYRQLRSQADASERFAVIGGGFIGSEIAAALAMNKKQVTLLFPEPGIGARVFPQDMSRALNDFYTSHGVQVEPGSQVVDVMREADGERVVKLADGRTLRVDFVVAGLGLEPNVELARGAGLKVDDGVVVDEFLRTDDERIWAAGDVASFPVRHLGRRMRVEHEDGAYTMGRSAGRAMAGHAEVYRHLPSFYSDLFESGYEAVGEVNARLQTVAHWRERFREGVVYYLQDGRVRGVLLVNVWGHVDTARRLIAERRAVTPADLPSLIEW